MYRLKRMAQRQLPVIMHCFVVFFALLVMLAALYDSAAMPKVRRGFYTENHISGYVPFEYDKAELLAFCKAEEAQTFALGRNFLTSGIDQRNMYFSESMEVPPTVSGRFFTTEEMLSSDGIAVIGADFAQDIYLEDGAEYVEIYRTVYRVIGVLGVGEPSRLDSMVYLPLGALSEEYSQNGMYILDSPSKETLEYFVPILNELLQIPDTGMPFRMEYISTSERVTKALAQMSSVTRISLVLLGSVALAALFFTASWVQGCAAFVRIGHTIGFCHAQIFWLVYAPYALFASCGIGGAALLYRALDAQDILLRMPMSWLLSAAGGLALCMSLQIAVLVFAMLRGQERRL